MILNLPWLLGNLLFLLCFLPFVHSLQKATGASKKIYLDVTNDAPYMNWVWPCIKILGPQKAIGCQSSRALPTGKGGNYGEVREIKGIHDEEHILTTKGPFIVVFDLKNPRYAVPFESMLRLEASGHVAGFILGPFCSPDKEEPVNVCKFDRPGAPFAAAKWTSLHQTSSGMAKVEMTKELTKTLADKYWTVPIFFVPNSTLFNHVIGSCDSHNRDPSKRLLVACSALLQSWQLGAGSFEQSQFRQSRLPEEAKILLPFIELTDKYYFDYIQARYPLLNSNDSDPQLDYENNQKSLIVAMRLDALAVVPQAAQGARMVVVGLLALLNSVNILSQVGLNTTFNNNTKIYFYLFAGESTGRMTSYDVVAKEWREVNISRNSLVFRNADALLEIGPMGLVWNCNGTECFEKEKPTSQLLNWRENITLRTNQADFNSPLARLLTFVLSPMITIPNWTSEYSIGYEFLKKWPNLKVFTISDSKAFSWKATPYTSMFDSLNYLVNSFESEETNVRFDQHFRYKRSSFVHVIKRIGFHTMVLGEKLAKIFMQYLTREMMASTAPAELPIENMTRVLWRNQSILMTYCLLSDISCDYFRALFGQNNEIFFLKRAKDENLDKCQSFGCENYRPLNIFPMNNLLTTIPQFLLTYFLSPKNETLDCNCGVKQTYCDDKSYFLRSLDVADWSIFPPLSIDYNDDAFNFSLLQTNSTFCRKKCRYACIGDHTKGESAESESDDLEQFHWSFSLARKDHQFKFSLFYSPSLFWELLVFFISGLILILFSALTYLIAQNSHLLFRPRKDGIIEGVPVWLGGPSQNCQAGINDGKRGPLVVKVDSIEMKEIGSSNQPQSDNKKRD